MFKRNLIIKLLIISLIFTAGTPAFAADTTPAPYDPKEFPQGLKDLRRFEIITLGSLPFVTLNTTLVYSGIQYVQHDFDSAYTPNIFAASTYDTDEQKTILLTSLGICIGVGITDYIIQVVKRNIKKKQNRNLYDDLSIIPIAEDPDATKIIFNEEEIVEEVEE